MPLNCIPKSLGRCLGLSSPSSDESSRSSSRSTPMTSAMTSVSNRPQTPHAGSRVQRDLARGARREPTPGPSVTTTMTMAADWRGSDADRVPRNADVCKPIQLWGCYDPAPEWGAALRRDAQAWADAYDVNTSRLIRMDKECTRYGLIELGGHPFVVGPTATPAEAQVLTRILKAHPQIGAIFCVEPGKMQVSAASDDPSAAPRMPGYSERPISEYISSVARRDGREHDTGAGRATQPPTQLDGSLSRVQFMEFAGMERFDAEISREVLWRAGRGVAEFMRENPGKIALVCSERGIARPCAVIASAALQLKHGDIGLRNALIATVVAQRSEASDHHINAASRSFDLIAEFARLLAMLRSPGRGEPRWERKVHLLRQRLPELADARGSAAADWRTDVGRRRAADILEANFETVAPLLASGGLPEGMALLWLRGEINVLTGVRFLSPTYIDGHIDRISQDDIDPDSADAVRLVSLDDYGLMCDNKYYHAESVAGWNRACLRNNDFLSNPVSRAPVVALLIHEAEKARLESLFLHRPE